jgi:hypothetical protein
VVAQADSLDNLRSAIERFPTDMVLLEGSSAHRTANAIVELLRIAPDVKLIVQAVSPTRTIPWSSTGAACAALFRGRFRRICWCAVCGASPPAKPGSTTSQ